jgi:uncharacterized membrane protein
MFEYILAFEPNMIGIERIILSIALWLRLILEGISILIVVSGVIVAAYKVLRLISLPHSEIFKQARFIFSRYLVMALEFQLAADIIGTAISPTWDQLGRLAVIATIRTFLSFFLQYEIKEAAV